MCDDKSRFIVYKGHKMMVGGGCYIGTSNKFARGTLPGISRTIKALMHDAGVVVLVTKEKYDEIQNYKLVKGPQR